MSDRIAKLRAQFSGLNINAFLVTFQPHLRYLSGFSGSSGVGLVTEKACFLITDGRYASQVRSEVHGWRVVITSTSAFEELQRRNRLRSGMRVGFDGNTVVLSQFQQLKRLFPKVKFLPKADCIEKIAVIKDQTEIALIREAVNITDTVFNEMLSVLRPGITELDVAAEISYRQRKHGAEADAFETIVASGERSSLPHGRATTKVIQKGDIVTLDFGCVYKGYHSDMTRTVMIGKPNGEAKKIYSVVREAQQRAIDATHSGMKAKDLDAVARKHIREHGYDKYYRHSLGHGIGLQIHESPRISVLSPAILATGNVITIEPGIYIPKLGGVRIEDDVVITNGSCEVLTKSPKHLIVL
ncbi:MAG TPA: aminopeptidase P family protein [Bacteroidota bacterium]|jgi:Xaa-Pro aminopeptidase|nr:aminopeptidase P family protein [Bacteroidota bacterium]